jgi:hypothetical protein
LRHVSALPFNEQSMSARVPSGEPRIGEPALAFG